MERLATEFVCVETRDTSGGAEATLVSPDESIVIVVSTTNRELLHARFAVNNEYDIQVEPTANG